jgi:hypothetical protein
MLPVFMCVGTVDGMLVCGSGMLLKLMEGVGGRGPQRLESVCVHVCLWEMVTGHEGGWRHVVRGEAVERIR